MNSGLAIGIRRRLIAIRRRLTAIRRRWIAIRRRWIGVKSTERRGNAPARGAWGGYRTRWGTARRAPTPYQQGQGEGGSTPAAEVEQHLQQVRVINHAVAVHIYTPEVAARLPEGEQHCQQVGVTSTQPLASTSPL